MAILPRFPTMEFLEYPEQIELVKQFCRPSKKDNDQLGMRQNYPLKDLDNDQLGGSIDTPASINTDPVVSFLDTCLSISR